MSDHGRDYVDAHSPYSGNLFLIHYRLGDLENDTHHHRLFMGVGYMAKKCRCSNKTIQRALNQMVEDGFLERLFPETAEHPAEYVFLFPETAVDILTSAKGDGGQIRKPRWTNTVSTPIYVTKDITENNSTSTEVEGPPSTSRAKKSYDSQFEEFWKLYPRKFQKGPAAEKFKARLRAGDSFEDLCTAAKNYATLKSGTEQEFILLGGTFLAKDRWKDYLGVLLDTSTSPRTFTAGELIAALAYDGYDSEAGEWCNPETMEMTVDNPANFSYSRPHNSKGQLVDADGNPYKLDAQGVRRSVVE